MQKKDNKIGNKTAYKEERQIKEKKRAREKDRNRFAKKQVQILACAHAQKTKKSVQGNLCPIGRGKWILLSGWWFLFLACPTGKCCFFKNSNYRQKDCNQSC